MHMMFSEEEREWVYTEKFGWPIKSGCPDDIRRSIEKKKRLLKKQEEWIDGRSSQQHSRS